MAHGQPPLRGVDVSVYQGTVDWGQVFASGKSFAIMKASEGVSGVDAQFAANWSGSAAHGLIRGAYHFFRPQDDPDAQARHFLAQVQPGPDDLPPIVDVELSEGVRAPVLLQRLGAMLTALEAATNRLPMIYTIAGFWNGLGAPQAFSRYPLWVANFGASAPAIPSPWQTYAIWQYADDGSVRGISGSVDLNVAQATTADELRAIGAKSAAGAA
jgi:lysozyme